MTDEQMIVGAALVLPGFAALTIALILNRLSAELSEFLRDCPGSSASWLRRGSSPFAHQAAPAH
jgi:hypothetical protein